MNWEPINPDNSNVPRDEVLFFKDGTTAWIGAREYNADAEGDVYVAAADVPAWFDGGWIVGDMEWDDEYTPTHFCRLPKP